MLSWKDGRRGALRQPIGTGFWFSCWSLGKLSHVVPEAFWHMPHPAAGILPSFDCSDLVIFAPECAEHLLFRSHCRDFQMFHRKNLCLIWPVEEGHMVGFVVDQEDFFGIPVGKMLLHQRQDDTLGFDYRDQSLSTIGKPEKLDELPCFIAHHPDRLE